MKRTKRKMPSGQKGHQRPKASRRAPAKKANAPLSARLRQRAEERLRRQRRGRKPGAGGQVAGADTERVVYELRVHQIELEMQNEELLRAQHELELSREKYFDLYDLAPVGYLTLNEPGRILEANLTAARLLGVARTDLVRQPLTRFILREDLGIFNQYRQQLFATRAPQNCELRLTRPGSAPFWVRGEAILAQDHGTAAPVCRMTLSDITERKRTEERMRQLAQVSAASSDYLALIGPDFRYRFVNDVYLKARRLRPEDMVGHHMQEIVGRERFEQLGRPQVAACLSGEAVETFEWSDFGSGVPHFLHVKVTPFREPDGTVSGAVMSGRDITERERMERALRESEQRLNRVVKNINDALIVDDVAGRVVYANEKFYQLFRIPEQKLPSLTLEDYVAPEWRKEMRDRHDRRVRGEPAPEHFEYEGLRGDGSRLWLEVSVAKVCEGGQIMGTQSAIRDITKRKRAEAFVGLERDLGMALAAAQELDEILRVCLEVTLLAAGMDCGAIYLKDHATGCLDMVVHAGFSAEFVENVSRYEADSPKTRLVEAGEPVYVNYARLTPRRNRAERREGLRAIAVVPIRHENRTIGFLNVASHTLKEVLDFARDAVEAIASQVGGAVARAQAEQALRASEARYRTLFEAIDEGFCVVEMLYDPDGKAVDYRFVEVNPAFEKHTGLQHPLGKTIRQMVPNYDAHWLEIYGKVARTGKAIRFEKPAKAMERHYDVFAFRIGGDGSQRVGFLFNDITVRTRVWEALRESEARYRSLFDNMVEGFAYCRMLFEDGRPQDFIYVEVNEAFQTLTGLKNVTGRKASEVIPGLRESDPELLERYGRVALTGQPERFETYVAALKMWFSISVYCPKKEHFVAVFDVITERKQVEEKLRASEHRYRELIENQNEGIGIVDAQERFAFSNPAGDEIFGLLPGSLVGRTLKEFTAPDQYARVLEQTKVRRKGTKSTYELEIIRADGQRRWLQVAATPRTDNAGEFVGTFGIFHDITERKRTEKKMQMFSQEIIAAREEERKRVSSVLHHDVGSLTVGISAHLDAVEQDLRSGKPTEALQWMKRTRKLFAESLARLKELAVELRPPELDIIGLRAALRQHFAQVTERGGTRIHFRETLGRKRVPGDTATILFRAAQEALTNAITHGQATRVDVDLRASKEEVTLRVHDNGKAFDPSGKTAQARLHLGLRVMREMALSAGGVFTVDSGRGKGTTVRVRLPIADWQKFRNHQSAIA